MSQERDLIVKWNDDPDSLNWIERYGRVAIHAFPRNLRCPGGVVAIVGGGNNIEITFKAAKVTGPTKVKLANGKIRANGRMIFARKGSVRRVEQGAKSPIQRWRAIGQFRYFDAAKMQAVFVGERADSVVPYPIHLQISSSEASVHFHPFDGSVPGIPYDHPEARLVREYVASLGEHTRLGTNYIPDAHLWVDLFDCTHWQLIEAKASVTREVLRMAIGQLKDYRRFYTGRHPALAVLLPSRPTPSRMKMLTDNRITVIFRTPRGKFKTLRWQDTPR